MLFILFSLIKLKLPPLFWHEGSSVDWRDAEMCVSHVSLGSHATNAVNKGFVVKHKKGVMRFTPTIIRKDDAIFETEKAKEYTGKSAETPSKSKG